MPQQDDLIGQRSIDIFTDPSHPASFSHPEKVLHYLRQERAHQAPGNQRNQLLTTALTAVKQALSSLPSYSRFKPLRKKYPKMTTRSDDADERWQLDLANVSSFGAENNDGFQYLLIVIDVFTRKLVVVPLYDKTGKKVSEATELVFMTSGRIPKSITTDSGRKFKSNAFKQLCRKYGIRQFYTIPDVTHASIVERVILTLRLKIGKYMLHNRTKRWADVIGDIVDSYNNSIHSTLKLSPNEAFSSPANRQIALFNANERLNKSPARSKLYKKTAQQTREGDATRIPEQMRRFRKSHDPTFSEDVYLVRKTFMNDKERLVARLMQQLPASLENGRTGTTPLPKSVFYPNEFSLVS